jgi:chemotaxis methyl-accepting protein methylase
MHRLLTSGTILEHELSELRLLVERQTGVLLDCPNSALAAHVSEYLETRELDSPAALFARLRAADQDPAVLPQFLDGVLNVTTSFYRHPGAMNALAKQALPQLLARKSAEGPGALRIWSAGCATGEEAYSIAMAICEAFPAPGAGAAGTNGANGNGSKLSRKDEEREAKEKNSARNGGVLESASPTPQQLGRDCSIHIVGSDLLASSVAVADRGLYPESALAGLPPATIRASFSRIGANNVNGNGSASAQNTPVNGASNGSSNGSSNGASNGAPNGACNGNSGSHLLVKPRLRSLVTFNTMNLTKPVYIGRFDCIFCMDVLPHLSRTQRTALLERLHLYLEPGGYLFLSQTERLGAPNLNFRAETYDGYTFHRKPLAASAAYGR